MDSEEDDGIGASIPSWATWSALIFVALSFEGFMSLSFINKLLFYDDDNDDDGSLDFDLIRMRS